MLVITRGYGEYESNGYRVINQQAQLQGPVSAVSAATAAPKENRVR